MCRAAVFSLAERSRRNRPRGRSCKEHTQFIQGPVLLQGDGLESVVCGALSSEQCIAFALTTSSLSGAARCSSSRKSKGRSLRVRTLGGVFNDRASSGVDWIRSRSLGLGNCSSLLPPDNEKCVLEFGISIFFNLRTDHLLL